MTSPNPTWLYRARRLMLVALVVLLGLAGQLARAQGATTVERGLPFNHATTGFVLDGAHSRERCESCHVQGVFRGTPRDCATCHRPGGRAPGKSAQHIPATAGCESCHSTVAWSPANFRHQPNQGVATGSCASCHNGATAPGKPAHHPVTNASCDSCHKTSGWVPAGYSHALALPGECSSCHNGVRAAGRPAIHIPTTASCDVCHTTGVAFSPVAVGGAVLHSLMTGPVASGNCTTCHGGGFVAQNAQAKPATHVATTAQCDSCHQSVTSWATVRFDHAQAGNVAGRCAECHGVSALGKPTNHVPTTLGCDSCHSNFNSFKPARMNHAGTAGQCASCHNGSYGFANAKAKASSHVPVTAQCDTCHVSGFASWSPARMDHTGQAGKCATCHSGGFLSQNAQVKPATHVATTAQCDTCHRSTTSWATASIDHGALNPPAPGRCSTCHNGAQALGKPTTHVPTPAQCDTCHTGFTAFKPARMNHSGLAGQCSNCHSGSYVFANAQAKPTNHVPTAAQCDSCHVNGFVTWSPAVMNHAGMSGQCATCHSGTYLSQNAQVKPVSHVVTTAQCDTCHRSTTSWATASYVHDGTSAGRCSSCHDSITALGKPTNHVPTTAQCDSCHSGFGAFKPARMNHAGTAGQCASCHNGAYVFANAQARGNGHIPTMSSCDGCHTGGFASWSPAVMNHAGLAGQCATCHSGAYLPQNAQVKPVTHIATTQQCDTCHKSTTSWATATLDHATVTPAVAGRCSSCHNGTQALGKPGTHVPTTAQCDTCHRNFTAFAPATVDHAATTGPVTAGNCSACHGGGYTAVGARTKPTMHVATTAQCDTCHRSTVSWAGTAYVHDTDSAGRCASCHNGTQAPGKPGTHVPTAAQCDTCHTNFASFKPARMNHAGLAGQCSSCHGGGYVAVNAQAKPTNHVPTAAQCDSCHVNGFSTFSGGTMNHAATLSPQAAGNCSTCHAGGYLAQNAQVKPTTHIATTQQCDTCHKSTTTWATVSFDHSTVTPAVTGRCSSCHNGTQALGKPGTHVPTTAQCDTCHRNFTAFAPSTVDHAATTGPLAAGNCASCHGGGFTAMGARTKPATHLPTTAQCDSCHTTAAWKPSTFSHVGVTPGACATCHNGVQARGKATSHLPTTAACDTCHTGFAAFAPARMNHAATTGPLSAGNCGTCHGGAYLSINAQVKPTTHVATTQQCDTCHKSTTSWATATYAHDSGASGRCSSCHNGTQALGKPTTHVPTTAQCDTCHTSFTAFRPARMSHTGTTGPLAQGNCASCHGGAYVSVNALAKPGSHIPTSAQCDSCHTRGYTAWSPAVMNHAGLAGQCATCHSGAYLSQNAQVKPVTHIPTAQQCDTCHKSTTSWATATLDHATVTPAVAGRCSSCHNGTQALGKPGTHVPTTAQCDTCHRSFTAFAPATVDHAATTGPLAAGNCASCHGGGYVAVGARSKPVTHLTTTAQCDSCHTTVAWKPSTFSHVGVTPGACATCHNGVQARGKATSHLPTTAACDSCHRNFNGFSPATMNHAGTTGPLSAGNCSTCHGGAYLSINAQVKPTTHVATTQQCDTCHKSTTSWATATYAHDSGASGRCSSCHNGTQALGKPGTHVPTTAQCDTCHKTFTAFAPATTNHAGTTGPLAAGNCSSCHGGGYTAVGARAKPPTHVPTTAQCDTCHKNYSAFAPATMNHAGTTGPLAANSCSTCHSGAYLAQNAQVKPTTHIATTQQCDTCHKSTTSWATATLDHSKVTPAVTGRCSSCHNGTQALGKPGTHVPTTAQCDTCHKNFTAFAPVAMNHAGTTGPLAAGNCASCHGGGYTAVGARAKPPTHVPTTAQCDTCHKNYTAFAPATMNHAGTTGPLAANSCSTCHSGAYLAQNAQVKPTTHIATTQQCDTCHKSTTSWATATLDHSKVTPAVAGRCSSCHNGTQALGKPGTHVPTTAQCDTCHKTFTAFAPATMSHSATTGPLAAGNCSTCHGGGYTAVGARAKPPTHVTTTAQCDSCHSTSAWKPAAFNHTGAIPGACATCHNGVQATGKSTPHIPTTQSCDSCHRTGLAWLPVITPYAHIGVAAGTCATCHTAAYPHISIKPPSHLPTTAACDACHHSFSSWLPTTYNHVGIAPGTCASCHGGSYSSIKVKPSNHIPTTTPAGMPGNECSLCHKSTTSFSSVQMNHGTIQTSCVTCHDSTSPYLGSMEKINRATGDHRDKNATGKDCSSSGCHKPLGTKGRPYTTWD